MKNTIIKGFFKVLCLVLFTFATLTVYAQPLKYAHLSKQEKENKSLGLINEADYIVEGVVKGHEFFYGEDEKTIYTAYTIEVEHWYKGKGENTIKLIKEGGAIGMDYQVDLHDPTPSIGVGPRYIFLLRESFKKGYYEFLYNNKEVLAAYPWVPKIDYYVAGFYGLKFNSVEELNDFFQKRIK